MKLTILSLAILASLLATVVTLSQTTDESHDLASKNDSELPRVIRVQAEFIEMPEALYTELISKPQTASNDTDLRARCAKLISAGDARIIESLCVTTLPGQSATTESVAEYTYPTHYRPGEVPSEINAAAPADASQWGTPPSPNSFGTQNTGATFEVEAQIQDNNSTVELRLNPTIVYLVDTLNWGAEKASGAAGPIKMPLFYTIKIRTGVNITDGQPTLVAALSPKNDKGFADSSRKVMIFARADILTVGK